MTIRIATILGTGRPGSYTAKALALAEAELDTMELEVARIRPGDFDLRFPGEGTGDQERLQELVSSATALLFATPEYHGTMAAKAKLIIENLGFPSVVAGKPVALLGAAAGSIGAIKSLEQLRSCLSHTGAIVLPGPVSVAGVRKVFDEEGRCHDEGVEKRIRGLSRGLVDYVHQNICPRLALETQVRIP
ncbi:MAG TPA: NAD(P)H-dependent oxidoreductase [Myxococcales bacterium LLY-WYZ-16_1]|jgi:FMN reductase|nr:NAD(P)H-dependent oxidoreductase [Myxococcales bacterium LLY-WYZ-16_1]